MKPYRALFALVVLGGMALPEAQAQVIVPGPGGVPRVVRPPVNPYVTPRRHRRRHRRPRVYYQVPPAGAVRPGF
jgi:hypothetical protein